MTDKKKYTVRHRLVIDYLRDVEADSEEEAIEKAKNLSVIDYWLDPIERHEVTDLGWDSGKEEAKK